MYEDSEPLHLDEGCEVAQSIWKTVFSFLKVRHIFMIQQFYSKMLIQEKVEAFVHKMTCMRTFTAAYS